MVDLVATLGGKWTDGTRPRDLYAAHVAPDPGAYVAAILSGIRDGSGKARSGCAELASLLSEDRPDLLWEERDLFVENLGARAPVVRWEAACVLGNLASVDDSGTLRPTVEPLCALLSADSIVLQGHAVRALSKMARAYPPDAPRILEALASAVEAFPGSRVGFVVEAMATFAAYPALRARAMAFALPYADSDVPSVRAKARRAVRALEARQR